MISQVLTPFRALRTSSLDARLARLEHKVTLLHEERRAQEGWQRDADVRLGQWLDQSIGKLEHVLTLVFEERRAEEAWARQAEIRLTRRLDVLEHLNQGGRATYLGDRRLLTKAMIGGHTFAFFIEAADRLLTPWFVVTGAYETTVTDYFIRELKADSHCVDVGANFGYFTCLMGKFSPNGRVVGVEPDDFVFGLSRDNVLINGLEASTCVMNAAITDQLGEVTLYRRLGRSGNNSIAKPAEDFTALLGEPPSEAFTAKSLRIDDLLPQMDGRIDFIKLDVEGAEPLVVAGARETIRTNPQLRIAMEWCPGQANAAGVQTADFLDQIAQAGLRAFDIVDGGLEEISSDSLLQTPYRAAIILAR